MTLLEDRPVAAIEDVPRGRTVDRDQIAELLVAAVAGLAVVWVPFHLGGWNAPLGGVVCWYVAAATIYSIVARQRHGPVEAKDRLATLLVWTGTVIALLPLGLMIYFVVVKGGATVLNRFPHFLTADLRHFGPRDPVTKAGIRGSIIGSLEQVLLATVVTVPVGVLAAAYINELGGRFAALVRTIADAMTGLPTIIAGLFVYSFWVLPRHTKGSSGFAAAMALSVVMLPTVVRTAEEVLRIVARELRDAALALGAPEWRVVLRVVLPTARTGLVTATILGIARAVGETAPVLLTAFGSSSVNTNVFRGAQDDLPLRIYVFSRGSSADTAVAWGGALVLVVIILTLFALARILGTGSSGRLRATATKLISRNTKEA